MQTGARAIKMAGQTSEYNVDGLRSISFSANLFYKQTIPFELSIDFLNRERYRLQPIEKRIHTTVGGNFILCSESLGSAQMVKFWPKTSYKCGTPAGTHSCSCLGNRVKTGGRICSALSQPVCNQITNFFENNSKF